jgi:deazaflavin-dependent oxidoreductase (nitroreductase family)
MARTFHPTFGVRFSNKMIATLLRAGVKMGNMTLLTVRGRKSGQLRTTPVVIGENDGQRSIIAPYGAVNWVLNLRAAGEATITHGRRIETITAKEVSATEAAPILKSSLAGAPSFLRAYFDVTPDSSLEDFIEEAPRHPVFVIQNLAR